jgi:hypothetical protein
MSEKTKRLIRVVVGTAVGWLAPLLLSGSAPSFFALIEWIAFVAMFFIPAKMEKNAAGKSMLHFSLDLQAVMCLLGVKIFGHIVCTFLGIYESYTVGSVVGNLIMLLCVLILLRAALGKLKITRWVTGGGFVLFILHVNIAILFARGLPESLWQEGIFGQPLVLGLVIAAEVLFFAAELLLYHRVKQKMNNARAETALDPTASAGNIGWRGMSASEEFRGALRQSAGELRGGWALWWLWLSLWVVIILPMMFVAEMILVFAFLNRFDAFKGEDILFWVAADVLVFVFFGLRRRRKEKERKAYGFTVARAKQFHKACLHNGITSVDSEAFCREALRLAQSHRKFRFAAADDVYRRMFAVAEKLEDKGAKRGGAT